MLAIVLLVVGALGLVGSVALFSWKAAIVVASVLTLVVGVDLGRTPPPRGDV